jgi:hypothetical protein
MLMQRAAVYLKDFIYMFRRSSEPTEPSDSGSECLSRQDTHEHAVSTIEEYRLDYHSARASASARLRDDNCCMLTGSKDYKEAGGTAIVQAVYIIPEFTINDIGLGEHGGEHSQAAVWSVLSTFMMSISSRIWPATIYTVSRTLHQ